jgi:hypothetical protein
MYASRTAAAAQFAPGGARRQAVVSPGCDAERTGSSCGVASTNEITDAIEAFLATPKRVVGYASGPTWNRGFSVHEVVMKYPIEIDGELRGSQLMIVGFPREPELKFRLGILFPGMICRLDYTDETHVNSISGSSAGTVPYMVSGPHYHSWLLNRRFFRGVTRPPKLQDAAPYTQSARTFDAVLRWFCADTRIESLPPNHLISLPARELLL